MQVGFQLVRLSLFGKGERREVRGFVGAAIERSSSAAELRPNPSFLAFASVLND
jgi:hypothetical protein